MDEPERFDSETRQRIGQMADLFKNSLVYTLVMKNVNRVIEDRSGSITLLVVAFMIIALCIHSAESAFFKLEQEMRAEQAGADYGSRKKGAKAASHNTLFKTGLAVVLLQLTIYGLELAANACIQFLSHLIATIAAESVVSDNVWWAIAGTGITGLVAYIGISVSQHTLLSQRELDKSLQIIDQIKRAQ